MLLFIIINLTYIYIVACRAAIHSPGMAFIFSITITHMCIIAFGWVELIPGRPDICYNKLCVHSCSLLHKLYTTSVKYCAPSGAFRGAKGLDIN